MTLSNSIPDSTPNSMTAETPRLELHVNRGFLFSKKKLVIDKYGILFGEKHLLFEKIESVRYGSIATYVNGVHSNDAYIFHFLDNAGKKFNVGFYGTLTKKSKQKAKDDYAAVIDILWKYLTSKIVNKMIGVLNEGGVVKVGNFEMRRNGIKISYKKFLFFQREDFLPWKNCLKGVGPGYFYIQSTTNKRIIATSKFLNTWDLNAFHSLVDYLWNNGICYKLEKGEKI